MIAARESIPYLILREPKERVVWGIGVVPLVQQFTLCGADRGET